MGISWREVNGAFGQWSLAGRRDTPPNNFAGSAAALIQFASTYINQQSMNSQIQNQLRSISPRLEHRLIGVATGHGIFVIVTIRETRHSDGQRSLSNAATHIWPSTYRNTALIFAWLNQNGAYSELSGDPGYTIVRRYFWGTRIEPITRRYIGGAMQGRTARGSFRHR